MKSKLSNGILIVLIANIVNLGFNLLTNLIVPKHLSIDSYAAIKTYQLYMSYIGIIHLGYNDGMYLKYGGKNLKNLDKKEMAKEIAILRIYLLVIMLMGTVISVGMENYILMMVLFAMLPTNLLSYFQFLYQACGEFESYGKILNFVSIGTFIVNIILIYVVNTDCYIYYLLGYVMLNIVIWIFTEIYYKKLVDGIIVFKYFSFKKLLIGMKSGILLTLGNFSSVIMTTMDRWFVSIMIGNIAFAQYAFAVSMENFLNTAITPITVTLYNYFCNNDQEENNRNMKQRVMVFGAIIIASAFPVKFILEVYLQKYYESNQVLFVLFASQLFYIVIKGIYVNLYKSRREQKKYFIDLIQVLCIGFILDLLGGFIFHKKEIFAWATLISAVVWMIKCLLYFKDFEIKEGVYFIVQVVSFLIIGKNFSSILGGIIYLSITFISTKILLPDVDNWVSNILKRKIFDKSREEGNI